MTTHPTPHTYIAHAWTALLVTLKLVGVVAWPWAAVTAPLWAHFLAAKIAKALATPNVDSPSPSLVTQSGRDKIVTAFAHLDK